MPDGLCKQPRLMLRGVDFAAEEKSQPDAKPEAQLKAFAEKYADRAITILALPYTTDRSELYNNISKASTVMMLSWHEGFGLAAWEAIAAGVPLIISEHSGVYKLLEEKHPGCEKGFIYPIDVRGTNAEPFFKQEDLESVAAALREIARQPEKARQKAGTLRGWLLNEYTWAACAEQVAKVFSWPLQKGVLPLTKLKPITTAPIIAAPLPASDGLPVHIPLKRWQAGGVVADSQLLRAEEALVPFDPARQPELDKLDDWLDDANYPQAVRLLTGAGGLGKTRLALHLCEQRIISGWYAGFLDSDLEAKELAAGWETLQALKQPLLIVIDYAETRQDELLALVKAMLQLPTEHPVRMLLLARDGGEWWDNLPGKNKDCEALLSSYATSGPYQLPPLHEEILDRQKAYKGALHAFAQALSVPTPEVTPELGGEHFGRPLYLQMAALLALRGVRPTTAQGLTRALLNHERRYWHGLFSSYALSELERHAEQLLALTTLVGGFPSRKAALPHWERAHREVLSRTQFDQLFQLLMPLYPGKLGLQAVRPDLLGEALVAQTLLRPSAVELLDAVLCKDAGKFIRVHALTVFARVSNNYPELHETLTEALRRNFIHCWHEFIDVATETSSNLPALAEIAFTRLSPNFRNQIANALAGNTKNESIQLSKFFCQITSTILSMHYQKHLKIPTNLQLKGNYATTLNNHSVSLHRAGFEDQALSTASDTLALFTELHKQDSQQFEADLAMSFVNYANRLHDMNSNEKSLTYSRQGLAIYQRLAEEKSDQFESAYATSLNNCAIFLAGSGSIQDALAYTQQAIVIRKKLLQDTKDNNAKSDLAASLSNCAVFLSRLGRYEDALSNEWDALEIRRNLASDEPDQFEPDFASSLGNYSGRLSEIGRNGS